MYIQTRRSLSSPHIVRRRSADARLVSSPSSSSSSSSSSTSTSTYSTEASTSTDTRVSKLRNCALFGPPSPVLHDGERQYRVEGLIDTGAFGRVALASIMGTSSPVMVAIKVYGRDQLGSTPRLDAMHDNECRIMCENARRESIWLVQSYGAFDDEWNRYLVMVRNCCVVSFGTQTLRIRIITPTRLLASFSTAIIGHRGASFVSGLKNLYVPLGFV
jgi:hypothetical protein